MPDYVEYSSLATVPGPLTASKATEWGFALEADEGKLETLCEKVFAEPTGGEVDVRPFGDQVVLTLGRIERLVSDVPRFKRMGWSPETQVDIWVPAARVRQDGNDVVAERFLMFMPYIWIDNAISLPAGREMYGYPKAFGWAVLPDEGADEKSFGLDVFGMNYGRDESPTRRPLIRVERGARHPNMAGVSFDRLEDVAHQLRDLFVREPGEAKLGFKFARQLLDDLIDRRVRQVFLKQIRAVEDGAKAALQQVTEASYKIKDMKFDGLDYEYECTINKLDSHPLLDELGLKTQTTHWGFRMEADFTLEPGRVIWDSAGP